jgi:anti-sigma factor RsiW
LFPDNRAFAEYVQRRHQWVRCVRVRHAATRLADTARLRRILYGFAATGLPPVLLYRIVKRMWRNHRHRRELVLSLPLLAPFVTAWAGGEIVGSWLGPGDALAKVC